MNFWPWKTKVRPTQFFTPKELKTRALQRQFNEIQTEITVAQRDIGRLRIRRGKLLVEAIQSNINLFDG